MKHLYLLLSMIICLQWANAQTVYDNETPATTLQLQYFESSLDGQKTTAIANPDASGINTSATVIEFIKAANSQTWAGGFANPLPTTLIDATDGGSVCVKVWMANVGNLALKLEGSTNGGENWITTEQYTTPGAWQELCFDFSNPSLEDSNLPGTGNIYSQLILFFDFGSNSPNDVKYYFDDITTPGSATSVSTTIWDFEADVTSGQFSHFGSNLEGTKTPIITNPNPSGINTSSKVIEFVKPVGAQVWAGGYSDPGPIRPIDVTNGGQVCIKVHMDHIGNFALKLEAATDGAANWVQQVSNTKINEWEELCFDVTLPSLEAPFAPAASVFTVVTLFPDFLVAVGSDDITSYVDDIVVKTGSAPTAKTVTFKVNMNSYTENFDGVYVSGTFNDWNGESNPLSDDDLDGIWEGSISVFNGTYEYLVTLDNWSKNEVFKGVEECTKTDDSGQFTNRLLLVGGNVDVPEFCFNSCYKCGEEVNITFRLGMGEIEPNVDGVWLAGGGKFDVPGGRYKMDDADGDKVYELTVPRQAGFSSFYAFANGPCFDFSCKENLEGQTCGDPNNFFDRFLPAIAGDVTVATCYGLCSTNVECSLSTDNTKVTDGLFEVLGNPSYGTVATILFKDNALASYNVEVLNNVGQRMNTYQVSNVTRFDVNTLHLSAGVYYIKVVSGNLAQTSKLVKI